MRDLPVKNPRFPSGVVIIPSADGHENAEFEARIAQQLAFVDHAEIMREAERLKLELDVLRRQILGESRVLKRTRLGRTLVRVWHAWSTFFGLAAVAIPIAFGFVVAVSGQGEIIAPLSAAVPDTSTVHEGGLLRWTQDTERRVACPGEAVEIYSPANGGSQVITQRRPVQNPIVRKNFGNRITAQLPPSMQDGRWHFTFGVDSRCPTYQRFDELAKFDIEVIP